MKKLFGGLYAIYGCAWAALAVKVSSGPYALAFAAVAAFCFLAAGLAFFANGWAWRLVHGIFATTTLVLWVTGGAWFLAYLLGFIRTYDTSAAGPLAGGFVAFVLTLPVIGYCRELAAWRRSRATARVAPGKRGPAYSP